MWIQVPRGAALAERIDAGGALLGDRAGATTAASTLAGYSTPAPNGAYVFIEGLAAAARFVDRASERHAVRSFVATSPTFGSLEATTMDGLIALLRAYPAAEGVVLSVVTGAGTQPTPAPAPAVTEPVTPAMVVTTPEPLQVADDETPDEIDALAATEVAAAEQAETKMAQLGSKVCAVDSFIPSTENGKLALPEITEEHKLLVNGSQISDKVKHSMAESLVGLSKIHASRDPVVSDLPAEVLKALDEKICDLPSWNTENAMLMADIAGCLSHATRFSPHRNPLNRDGSIDIRYLQLSEVVFGFARKLVDKISPLCVGNNPLVFRDVLRTYRSILRACVHTMTSNQLFFGAQEGKYMYPAGTPEAEKYPNGRGFSIGFLEISHYENADQPDETIYDRDGRFQLHKVSVPKFPLDEANQVCYATAQRLLDVLQSDAFATELIHRFVLGNEAHDLLKLSVPVQDSLDNTASQVDGMLVAHLSGARNIATKIIGLPHETQSKIVTGMLGSRDSWQLELSEVVTRMMGTDFVSAELTKKFVVNLSPMINTLLTGFGPALKFLQMISAKIKQNVATALTTYVNVCVNAGVVGPHVLIGFKGADLKDVGVLLPQGVLVELFRQNVVKSRSTAPKDLLSSKRLRELQKFLGERAFAVVDNLRKFKRVDTNRNILILVESDGASSEIAYSSAVLNETVSATAALVRAGMESRKILGAFGALVVEFAELILEFGDLPKSKYPGIADRIDINDHGDYGFLSGRIGRLDCRPTSRPGTTLTDIAAISRRLPEDVTIPEYLREAAADDNAVWGDCVDLGTYGGSGSAVNTSDGSSKLPVYPLMTPRLNSMFGSSDGSYYGSPSECHNPRIGYRYFRFGQWLGWLHHNNIEDLEQSIWWLGSGYKYATPMIGAAGLTPDQITGAKRLHKLLSDEEDNVTPWYDWPPSSHAGDRDARGDSKIHIGCTILDGGNRLVFHQRFCRGSVQNLIFEVGINLLTLRKFGSSMFRSDAVSKVESQDYIETEFSQEYSKVALATNSQLVQAAMNELRTLKENYRAACRDKIPLARRLTKETRDLKHAGSMIDMEKHAKSLVERKVIQGFRVRGDALKIKTNEINLICGPAIYLFGEYSVSLRDFFAGGSPEGPRVRFWNMTRQINGGHDHPHVRGGNPCLGNLRGMLTKSVKDKDLTTSISLLIGYLQSVNLQDQYGETMQKMWPYVPCNLGNLVRYGVEDGLLNDQLLLQVQAKNDKNKMTVRTIKDLLEKGDLQDLFEKFLKDKEMILEQPHVIMGSRSTDNFGSFKTQFTHSQAQEYPIAKLVTKRSPDQLKASWDTAVKYLISCYGCKLPEQAAVIG